jgi:hypothetical protein
VKRVAEPALAEPTSSELSNPSVGPGPLFRGSGLTALFPTIGGKQRRASDSRSSLSDEAVARRDERLGRRDSRLDNDAGREVHADIERL